jgi:GTP cyclohydrolase I
MRSPSTRWGAGGKGAWEALVKRASLASVATVSDAHEHARPSSSAALSGGSSAEGPGIAAHRPFDPVAFEAAVQALVAACGIDVDTNHPHMKDTAARVRALWQDRLLGGYGTDPAAVLGRGFADPRTDLVVVQGISVHGVCPHHLVPFRGKVTVAYVPGGRLHGFGRIARLVDALAHRFTYQEWLTRDIADAMVTHGLAAGAACIVDAEQLCLLLGEDRRGDERVRTQAFAGVLATDPHARSEALRAMTP